MAKFPTFKGSWPRPWIGSYCIPSCITRRPLPTYQISLKSKKLFVDGRTFETHFIRSTQRSGPKHKICGRLYLLYIFRNSNSYFNVVVADASISRHYFSSHTSSSSPTPPYIHVILHYPVSTSHSFFLLHLLWLRTVRGKWYVSKHWAEIFNHATCTLLLQTKHLHAYYLSAWWLFLRIVLCLGSFFCCYTNTSRQNITPLVTATHTQHTQLQQHDNRVRTEIKMLFSRIFQDLQRPNSRVFQD